MTLAAFAELCQRLAATRSRTEKVRAAAAFLRELAPDAVPWAVAFLTGRPFPASDGRVLDLGWATLAGLAPAGAAAAGPPLGIEDAARAFEDIAAARGPGSRVRKVERLAGLLARATPAERDALVRIVQGEMRTGLHEGLVQEAIAEAAGVETALVRRALLLVADPAVVARMALAEGPAALAAAAIRLFVPLQLMLADLAPDPAGALSMHGGRTALEWKYDGARIQLHKADATVRIWSRRLTEVTRSLPDIVALAGHGLRAASCILDGEVVAVGADGRPLPFQELMRRLRRVHGVDASAQDVPLRLHLFDCLLADGRALIDEPYETRFAALAALADPALLARRAIVDSAVAAEAFYGEALAAGHEGLVAKALDGAYTPGSRGRRWLKVKPAETLDCVIVAADRGSGRRRGWLSNYHLAVRDGRGGFAPLGKTFKGLTDREFAAMTDRLRALALADDGYTVTVRPEVVVEVAHNEIQRSPQYASGFALRFARIARIRDDKTPDQASTLSAVAALYERQFAAKSDARRARN